MVQINFALKEVNCKIVYYGPGLSGKTTNLEVVHSKAPRGSTGELTSIATEGDRTLFFDFMPLNLGQVAGMTTKFQIYTVPGQVYYNSTRKLVLQGADGIVFVADSRRGKMEENIESFENMEENLREYGMDIRKICLVMQYNKRDLNDVYSIEELEKTLNKYKGPYFEAVAVTGEGVFPTLKKLAGMVLENLNRQQARPDAPARQPERVPVAVGAPAEPRPVAPARRTASTSSRASTKSTVVREPVVASAGVRTIDRRGPPRRVGSTVRRKAVEAPAPPPKRRRGPLLWIVMVGLSAAVLGLIAYAAGLLDVVSG